MARSAAVTSLSRRRSSATSVGESGRQLGVGGLQGAIGVLGAPDLGARGGLELAALIGTDRGRRGLQLIEATALVVGEACLGAERGGVGSVAEGGQRPPGGGVAELRKRRQTAPADVRALAQIIGQAILRVGEAAKDLQRSRERAR